MGDAGYDIRLYCAASKFLIGPEDYYHDYFSNIDARDITYEVDYDRLHYCLKQMSGYSFAPYFAKKYFFYTFDFSDNVVQKQVADIPSDKKWIPKKNNDFVKKMLTEGITLDAKQPVLSFNYVLGCHRPYRFDEKCNEVKTPFDEPLPTTRGVFYILSEFIRLLKENSIYDNTAILVCSDHGGNSKPSTHYDMTFMIKPFHENKTDLSIDKAKVQSIDILPTLLKLSCGDSASSQSGINT